MLVTINRNCPHARREARQCRHDDAHRDTPQQGEIRPPLATGRRRRTAGGRTRASSPCDSRTSAPRPASADPRSTATSPTRRRCSSSSWSGSAPGCSPAPPTSSRTPPTPAAALDGLIDFHLDFALGESDLIRIQDRDLGHLPAAAERQVRRSQRQYVEIWVDVLRQLDPTLDEADARLMAHATFGLLNSTPHSVKPEVSDSPRVLRGMTLAALRSAGRRSSACDCAASRVAARLTPSVVD